MHDQRKATADREWLRELKSHVVGEVLLPGDDGYDTERAGWNLLVEHRPEAIVVAAGHEDVATAVRFAGSAGLPVAVQSTGHGPSIPADGAVFIATRYMTDLDVDPVDRSARLGPGVKWEGVIDRAGAHGLAPLVGSTPDVSAIGYLTGGGLPVLGRQYGFAADLVRSFELITADGRLRRVTADTQPDLFWAVRGGKDNFGVVTSMEIDLLPLSRIYGGGMFFPGAATRDVLRGWLEWTATQPDEMSSSVALARFPDTPDVPDPLRGTFMIHLRIAYTGPAADGERLVQPLRALEPVLDSVADMPTTRIGDVHSDPTDPVPVRDRGTLLRDLDDVAVDLLTSLAGPDAQLPPGLIELRHLGGALARPPVRPHAVGQRDAAFSLVLGMLAMPGETDHVDRLQEQLFDSFRPWDTGSALPNFLGSAVETDQVRTAYRDVDYERLRAIKATYDPHNLFRVNHNIPPRTP